MPRTWQISRASAGCALPVNTFRLFMLFTPMRPALRFRLRPVVGAGGFEPPVLDPKSSVLPLDDAPTVGSRWLPVSRRCGIVRVEGGRSLPGVRAAVVLAGAALGADPAGEHVPVFGQHPVLDLLPRLVVQGMRDVPERPVLPLLAGHRDEKAVDSVDDFDIAHHEAVVDDDGDKRLQFVFVDREDADIGDLHARRLILPPSITLLPPPFCGNPYV